MATSMAKEQRFNYDLPTLKPGVVTVDNLIVLFEDMYVGKLKTAGYTPEA